MPASDRFFKVNVKSWQGMLKQAVSGGPTSAASSFSFLKDSTAAPPEAIAEKNQAVVSLLSTVAATHPAATAASVSLPLVSAAQSTAG